MKAASLPPPLTSSGTSHLENLTESGRAEFGPFFGEPGTRSPLYAAVGQDPITPARRPSTPLAAREQSRVLS